MTLKIIFLILTFIDKFFKVFGKISFFQHLNDYINKKAYYECFINNKKTSFFVPSYLTLVRSTTILTKEPDTLKWIENFKQIQDKNIVFWDIGANVGLYSIYAARIHSKIKVFSFEASTSNMRCLSRNISINNLSDKISLCQIPLTDKQNKFLEMNEKTFTEGGASSTFGENFDYTGKAIHSIENKYKIFGTSINYFLKNDIVEMPNYLKIDVDGIEHMILEGANEFLSNKNILGISVELNKNFKKQFESSFALLEQNGFTHNPKLIPEKELLFKGEQIMNFHFERKGI